MLPRLASISWTEAQAILPSQPPIQLEIQAWPKALSLHFIFRHHLRLVGFHLRWKGTQWDGSVSRQARKCLLGSAVSCTIISFPCQWSLMWNYREGMWKPLENLKTVLLFTGSKKDQVPALILPPPNSSHSLWAGANFLRTHIEICGCGHNQLDSDSAEL